jgi:type III secretion protein T
LGGNAIELDALHEVVKTVLVILPRITAIFIILPLLSGAAVGTLARGAITLSLACVLYPHVAPSVPAQPLSIAAWGLIGAKELAIGVLIGFLASTFFWVIQSVGHMVDFQTGVSSQALFDPLTHQESGPTAGFLLQLALVLFLVSGGLLAFIGLIYKSYAVWPVFSYYPHFDAALETLMLRQTDSLMSMIIKLAAPVIVVLLVLDVGLGLLNRFVPQFNVFMISMPLKAVLALLILAVSLGVLYEGLRNFFAADGALFELLRAVL